MAKILKIEAARITRRFDVDIGEEEQQADVSFTVEAEDELLIAW